MGSMAVRCLARLQFVVAGRDVSSSLLQALWGATHSRAKGKYCAVLMSLLYSTRLLLKRLLLRIPCRLSNASCRTDGHGKAGHRHLGPLESIAASLVQESRSEWRSGWY